MSKPFETLADFAPAHIVRNADGAACIAGIDPYLKAVAEAHEAPALYKRLGELTSAQLDHMAVQMDVDVWRNSWPIEKKRSMILASYDVKRHAGTVGAVRAVLRALGATVQLVEWWETTPKGTPHTFQLTAIASPSSGNSTLTEDEQLDLVKAIDNAKPVRSHYLFTLATAHQSGFFFSANVRHAVYCRLHNL